MKKFVVLIEFHGSNSLLFIKATSSDEAYEIALERIGLEDCDMEDEGVDVLITDIDTVEWR